MSRKACRIMRSTCIVLVVVMLFLASWTHEAVSIRISPRIGATLIEEMNRSEYVNDDALTSVIVTGFSDFSDAQMRQLLGLGPVNQVTSSIATVRLPRNKISDLTRFEFLARVDDGQARPTLDVSVPSISANLVWETIKDSQGRRVDGSGVIVGIVDTGIDWKHPDFKFENGSSKILFLWDQTEKGIAPAGYSYGIEWTRSQIEVGDCTEKDTSGHGTHVAGIAAGTGLAREGKYVGVAPGAVLIFVKSGGLTRKGWGFRFSEVLDGVTYIWRKALALGKRVVISLSLGGHSGGHDGTASIEKSFDRLISEGAIIINAAGNSATSRVHAEGKLGQGESTSIGLKLDANETELYFETWFSRSDDFAASLKTPSGQEIDGPTSREGFSTSDGKVYILEDSTEKGKAWTFCVSSSKDLVRQNWTVTLTGRSVIGDGAWDAWIATYGQIIDGSGYEVTSRKTIIIPGTAQNIITVGAYVTKMRWTNRTGEPKRYTSSENEGDIAVFSSIGPTRDGRLKPEISAPGKGIVAPRSSDTRASESDSDDFYTIKAGTSMAAPHIAGVVALLLQYNFYLSPNQTKSIIRSTSKQDERTGEIDPAKGSTVWGYGKVDAKPAVRLSSGMYSIRVSVKGIPPSSSTKILIDGAEMGSIAGETSTVFEFEGQITHTLIADKTVNASDKTRYMNSQNAIQFSSPIWHTFLYTTQHHISVVSQYGNPRGSGWYDTGSRATISVEPEAVARETSVMLIYTKTTYATFDHWTAQSPESVSLTQTPETAVLVDGPKTVTAEWRIRSVIAPNWTVIIVLVTAIVVVGVASIALRRKFRVQNAPLYSLR